MMDKITITLSSPGAKRKHQKTRKQPKPKRKSNNNNKTKVKKLSLVPPSFSDEQFSQQIKFAAEWKILWPKVSIRNCLLRVYVPYVWANNFTIQQRVRRMIPKLQEEQHQQSNNNKEIIYEPPIVPDDMPYHWSLVDDDDYDNHSCVSSLTMSGFSTNDNDVAMMESSSKKQKQRQQQQKQQQQQRPEVQPIAITAITTTNKDKSSDNITPIVTISSNTRPGTALLSSSSYNRQTSSTPHCGPITDTTTTRTITKTNTPSPPSSSSSFQRVTRLVGYSQDSPITDHERQHFLNIAKLAHYKLSDVKLLQQAPSFYQDDPTVVKILLCHCQSTVGLQYASSRLRNDTTFIHDLLIVAILPQQQQQHDQHDQHDSKKQKNNNHNNKHIQRFLNDHPKNKANWVMNVLKYSSSRLQNDIVTVQMATSMVGEAIGYASTQLQRNKQLFQFAYQNRTGYCIV